MDPIKITCPHCGNHECFEESEVPAGMSEKVSSYMCVSCGYTTTTLNEVGSQMISEYEEITAELIKELRWVDPATNLVWYPIVLNFPSFGIIFPDGVSNSEWGWMAAPAIDIPQEEQSKYPIPGSPDQFYTRRINMDAGRRFSGADFRQACEYIGFIQK